MGAPSPDGRIFAPVAVGGGEVSPDTTFHYTEVGDLISATYSGGRIRRGYLVGLRTGAQLEFRYAQLHTDRTTAGGHCEAAIEMLSDGRLRIVERWVWESREGSGDSIVEELAGWGAT